MSDAINWEIRELKPLRWQTQLSAGQCYVLMRRRALFRPGATNPLALLKPWFEIYHAPQTGILTIQQLRAVLGPTSWNSIADDYFRHARWAYRYHSAFPGEYGIYGTDHSGGPLPVVGDAASIIPEADILNAPLEATIYHANEPTRVYRHYQEGLIIYDPIEFPTLVYPETGQYNQSSINRYPSPQDRERAGARNALPTDDMYVEQWLSTSQPTVRQYTGFFALVYYGPEGKYIHPLTDDYWQIPPTYDGLWRGSNSWNMPILLMQGEDIACDVPAVRLVFDSESYFATTHGQIHMHDFGWGGVGSGILDPDPEGKPAGTTDYVDMLEIPPPRTLRRVAPTIEQIADEFGSNVGNSFFAVYRDAFGASPLPEGAPRFYFVRATYSCPEWLPSLPLGMYVIVAQATEKTSQLMYWFEPITAYQVYGYQPTYHPAVGVEVPFIDEPLPVTMELVYQSEDWYDIGLTEVQIYNASQPHCPDPEGTLDWNSPPTGYLSTAYSHEVIIEGIRDVKAIGLPTGLELDVDTKTVGGEPTQLGSFAARLEGFRINNGCPVSVPAVITIGACDPEGSQIIAHNTAPLYQQSDGKYIGHGWPGLVGQTFPSHGVGNPDIVAYVESVGLVAPAELDSGSLYWLDTHGLSFDSATGVVSGIFTGWGGYMLRFEGVSVANECPIVTYVPVYAPRYCPHYTNYEELDANIVAWPVPEDDVGLAITVNLSTSGLIAQAITPTNINPVDDSESPAPGSGIKAYWRQLGSELTPFAQGLPPGMTLTFDDFFGPPTWGISRGFSDETPTGTYMVYLEGRVYSMFGNIHEGCPVRRWYRLIVAD